MKRNVLIFVCFVFVVILPDSGLCDYATPLPIHLKRAKESYRNRDYGTTIIEASNALYHERSKAVSYSYLAKSYEKINELVPAILAYMKYSECCKPDNIRKARRKIDSLKAKVDNAKLKRAIKNIPQKVLKSESYYKRDKIFRVKDYIYNPKGQIVEEKFCRTNSTYEYKVEYLYDRNGNLTDKMKFDNIGYVIDTVSMTYEDGKKTQEVTRNSGGDLVSKIIYKHDLNGNVSKILWYDRSESLTFEKTFLYNGDDLYEETSTNFRNPGSLDNYTARYIYKNGQIDKKEINYRMGLFEKVKYVYKNNRLVKEIFYNTESTPIRSKKYSYFKDGNLRQMGDYKIFQRRKLVITSKVNYEYSQLCD